MEGETEVQRIYRLRKRAGQRADMVMRERRPAEWKKLFDWFLENDDSPGEIPRGPKPKHVPTTKGYCAECGNPFPCRISKNTERNKRVRQERKEMSRVRNSIGD